MLVRALNAGRKSVSDLAAGGSFSFHVKTKSDLHVSSQTCSSDANMQIVVVTVTIMCFFYEPFSFQVHHLLTIKISQVTTRLRPVLVG